MLSDAIIYTLMILGIPYIFSYLISKLGLYLSSLLSAIMWKPSRYLMIIGEVIHELSHLVVAIIFGHKIVSFHLASIEPHLIDNDSGEALNGEVISKFNQNNGYAKMGRYFIGLAPVFACSLIIGLSFKRLIGSPFTITSITTNISSFSNFMKTIIHLMKNVVYLSFHANFFSLVLFLIIFILISISGFNLSTLDFKTSIHGMPRCAILLTILLFLMSLIGLQKVAQYLICKLLTGFVVLICLLIIFLSMLDIVFKIIEVIKVKQMFK